MTTLYRRHTKRLLDLALTLPALTLLSPLLAAIALAVRLRLGAPVLFRQQRPGLHGEPFTLLKFRTMTGARDAAGNLLPDAERVTPLGRFLRRTSLDELPELWNVLRGEMSLVGPRPLLVEYLPYYTENETRRHCLRPGITGLAQVNGRTAITWEARLALDVRYVESVSLRLDAAIILKTIAQVLAQRDIRDQAPQGPLSHHRSQRVSHTHR